MASKSSMIARQLRLQQWVDDIRECNARPAGMTVDQWCNEHGIKKAAYYWRLRTVRETCIDTMKSSGNIPENGDVLSMSEKTEFVELKKCPVRHDTDTAVIHIGSASIELPEGLSDEMIFRIMKAVAHVK